MRAVAVGSWVAVCLWLAGCGGGPEGGCFFNDVCSFGSSYYGIDGKILCDVRGGTWEDECPAANCVGACVSGAKTYTVWYYSPDYTQSSGQQRCDDGNDTFSPTCEWVLPQNAP